MARCFTALLGFTALLASASASPSPIRRVVIYLDADGFAAREIR
jgi:hypothetical protein